MAKIYALMDGQLVLYVGSTNDMQERLYNHRSINNDTTSRHIPKDCDWEMILLEECEDSDKIRRERHYIETLNPLYNLQIPGRSRAEYAKTEKAKKYQAEYAKSDRGKELNREAIKRYRSQEHVKEAMRVRQRLWREKKATSTS